MAADDVRAVLEAARAAGERFVVVLGPGVSDQAAIPLPYVSSAASPSLTALCRREVEQRAGEALLSRLAFFRKYIAEAGWIRYAVLAGLLLFMASLPIKMVLRWTINLKYLVAIPEFFFNI